jgi:hypothetical protein
MAIDIKGDLIQVFKPTDKTKFEKGFGYIHENRVYIYRGKLKRNHACVPASVYKTAGDKMAWIDPPEEELEEYSVSKIFPLSLEGIYEEAKLRANLKDLDPVLLEESEEYYAPSIIPQDDVLKVLIKRALQALKCSIKPVDVGSKKDKSTWEMLNNLKSNLTNPDTRMSILYFAKWCWLLGIEANIQLRFTKPDGTEDEISEIIRYNQNIR